MDREQRNRLAEEALAGYLSGPDAPIEATAEAVRKAESAQAVILVEGISDQIAIETLAGRQGRDFASEGTVVVPIGGAQAIGRYLSHFGPEGLDLAITGMCDVGEEDYFRHALGATPNGTGVMSGDLEKLGFFVCVKDLEDELIRASSSPMVEELLDSQGDLGSFRTMQKQATWRGAPFDAQMHRWLRAGAGRNLRYARLLVLALDLKDMPRPLSAVIGACATG